MRSQATPNAKTNSGSSIGAVFILALMFGVPGYAYVTCQKEARENDAKREAEAKQRKLNGDKVTAWVMAKRFVEKQLRSPGTADYGSVLKGTYQSPEEAVADLGNRTYLVAGWVDAQNGFGAVVRNNFTVKLEYAGDGEWKLLEPVVLKSR